MIFCIAVGFCLPQSSAKNSNKARSLFTSGR
jgi:hypothetical protein